MIGVAEAKVVAGPEPVCSIAGLNETIGMLFAVIITGYEPGARPAGIVMKAVAKPMLLPGSMETLPRVARLPLMVAVKDAVGTATGDDGARAPLAIAGVVAPT